jgi:hypothetical protein
MLLPFKVGKNKTIYHETTSTVCYCSRSAYCCTHSETFSQTDWHITGNAGTNAATNFVGTTDNKPLSFRTNNAIRMRINTNKYWNWHYCSIQKLDVNGNISLTGFLPVYGRLAGAARRSFDGEYFLGVSAAPTIRQHLQYCNRVPALLANQTGSSIRLMAQMLYCKVAPAYRLRRRCIVLEYHRHSKYGIGVALYFLIPHSFNTAVG